MSLLPRTTLHSDSEHGHLKFFEVILHFLIGLERTTQQPTLNAYQSSFSFGVAEPVLTLAGL
jgi:hypothetical protein